jgi:hypothetical protein
MQHDAPTTLVATVAKNAAEEVRVSLSEFKGSRLVDMRIYAEFGATAGEKKATKKGVALKLAKLPALIEALQAAQAEAEKMGLLAAA